MRIKKGEKGGKMDFYTTVLKKSGLVPGEWSGGTGDNQGGVNRQT